jgi:hypothetical protein
MRNGGEGLEKGPRMCLRKRETECDGGGGERDDENEGEDAVIVFPHVLCTWWKNASRSVYGACRAYEKEILPREGEVTSDKSAVHWLSVYASILRNLSAGNVRSPSHERDKDLLANKPTSVSPGMLKLNSWR